MKYSEISCLEIAEKLGLELGTNGNYHCFNADLHTNGDQNASLQISDIGFTCHGCGIRGNGVELVKQFFRIETEAAFAWLKEYFHDYKQPEKSEKKYHIRRISKDTKFRYVHAKSDEIQLQEPSEGDINKIQSELGKKYTLRTFEKAGVRICTGKYYGMVFTTGNIEYNPNKNTRILHLEGRTDWLTAIEMRLDEEYCLVSIFNKTTKIKVGSGDHIFILDRDDSQEEKMEHIKIGDKARIKFIRLPDDYKDLSDFYNSDPECKSKLDVLIESTLWKKTEEEGPDIFELLEQTQTEIILRPAQEFAEGKMWYSFKAGSESYVLNSSREYFPIKEPPSAIRVKSIPTMSQMSPRFVQDFLRLNKSLDSNYQNGDFIALELFVKVKSYLERYIFFKNKHHSTVLTLWIIGTYIFKLFQYYPYLHIQAEKASGKSLLMEVMSQIAFNGKMIASTSASSIFRDVEVNQTTLFIDEVERLGKYSKENNEQLLQILNTGFMRNGLAERVSKTANGYRVDSYSTYCPKALAGIAEINDVLFDRCIPIKMSRKKSSEKTERFKLSRKLQKEITILRDHCYEIGLFYAPSINQFIDDNAEIEGVPEDLKDRERDIFEPLFIIGIIVEKESILAERNTAIIKALRGFSLEVSKIKQLEDQSQNETVLLLKIIFEMITNGDFQMSTKTQKEYLSRNEVWNKFDENYRELNDLQYIDSKTKLTNRLNKAFNRRVNNFLNKAKDKQWRFENGELADLIERYTGEVIPEETGENVEVLVSI